MKIIQLITKKQRRGAEIFACQLAEKLLKKGHELLVVSLYEGDSDLPFSGEIFSLNANPLKRWNDLKAWKRLDSLIQDFQPDLIQANASETLKFAVFSKKLFKWKTPFVYRNANLISRFLDSPFKRLFNRWLMAEVDAVISVSETTLKDFRKQFNVPQQISIPIGIDSEAIFQAVHQSASVSISGDYLIYIGGLVREKDPLALLGVFGKVLNTFPSLHLVYLGSGVLDEALKNLVQKNGWDDQVHLLFNQKNVFPILSKAKALVMPSLIEGLPAVILEAMILQVPVIAYNVGGISEVLQSGKTGWLIPSGDQDGFQKAIIECLSLPTQDLEEITTPAKKLVEEHFEITRIASAFEAFYKQLIN